MTPTVPPPESPAAENPFIDPQGEAPLREEVFGLERLEAYARDLAAASTVAEHPPFHRPLLHRLRDDGRFIAEVYREITSSSRRQEPLAPDAEWLVDNYYIVEDVLREVKQDLPQGYYTELPVLASGPLAGYPRVLALALGLIAHTDSSLDETELLRFVRAYQTVKPLTIGELWAVPTMLRLGLIENLRRLASQWLETRKDRECGEGWSKKQLAEPAATAALVAPPERLSDQCVVALLQTLRDQGTAGPAVEWLEEQLARKGTTPAEVLRREHQRQAANQVSIGNCVTTLRLLGALDWSRFFERASLVEAVLRRDPAGAYGRQEFATRDQHRRAVEQLARGARLAEEETARRALRRAEAESDPRRRCIGYFLIDAGRPQFERDLGYRPTWKQGFRDLLTRRPNVFYFGSLLLLMVLPAAGVGLLAAGWSWWALLVLAAVLLPASELAVGVVHALVTRLLPPRVLPKYDFKDGIPADCTTFVVIPSLLARAEGAAQLIERLELHYLANADPQLYFALLTDFADAGEERRPEDDALVAAAAAGVRALNDRHAPDGKPRFFLFHRRRLWNPGEGRWMGWERKRGKLIEFNRLLRGDRGTSYAVCSTPPEQLPFIRFVLTLDADTNLPRDSARRLVGTLAHPLNQPQYDPAQRRVTAGYGLLQPRVSFLFRSSLRSRFARIFAASAGVDPYSAAVSDVYQDLFGEGSYTGKGLYDVDAFRIATEGVFPDNHILSHDLIESNFARCGLVTDVELLDDFPAKYHAYARREHRWVRGDWQLLPWLGPTVSVNEPPGRLPNPLPLLGRWKLLDNLRRSILPPALLALLILGWTVLPGGALLWTGLALLVVALPLVLQLAGGLWDAVRGSALRPLVRGLLQGLPPTLGQVLLSLIFLPDQAALMVHAIAVTLYRLFVSRRRLLEWETAAAAERRLGGGLRDFFVIMWPAPVIAVAAGALVAVAAPAALPVALPLLLAWLLAPLVAYWVSQPPAPGRKPLEAGDRQSLRRVARKTWGFFEAFIGPEDNWLPPDNYQEDPRGELAHRTSPTNKGLLLLSTLAAHDLGYISLPALGRRLGETFATLQRLERHNGHFLNWYDTRTLQPLQPGYISTVDSGNLLGCLLTLKQGLIEKLAWPAPSPAVARDGLADVLRLIAEEFQRLRPPGAAAEVWRKPEEDINHLVKMLEGEAPADLVAWDGFLSRLEPLSAALEKSVGELEAEVKDGHDELARWTKAFVEQVRDCRAELADLAPWAAVLREAEGAAAPKLSPEDAGRWESFRRSLAGPIRVGEWPGRRDDLLAELASWEKLWPEQGEAALPIRLTAAIRASGVEGLAEQLGDLARQADELAAAMDFEFLFDPDRNLFSIGFNLPLGRLDNSHYDLLASEACLASFLTVARGEAPRKHWFQLGRPATRIAGREGLLSWGGTMFEYLMPRLMLPNYPGTLLDAAQQAAFARQVEYGKQNKVPWGVSESAFYLMDASQDYQYQSFGVPGLGIKRGLGQDLVIAPYATALAAMVDPVACRRNLDALRALGAEGPHGFYEAVDFTPARVEKGKRLQVVRSYMAHHQGMSLVALTNCLVGDLMPRRLRAEPLVRAAELLLQERVPLDAPLVEVHPDEAAPRREEPAAGRPMSRRITTPHTPGPRTHLLSNGEYSVLLTNAGGGFSACRGLDVTRWREDRTADARGQFCYVRDLQTRRFWSAAFQPTRVAPDLYEVVYSADKAEFRRIDGKIETHLEVAVSPEKNVEVRRITLTNHDTRPRDLEATSYVEVALCPRGADLAHPAFQKLFLETEWVPRIGALLCRRRPRAADERPVWAVHVLASEGGVVGDPQYETDRARFLGRRRAPERPAALDPGAPALSGATGPVLDPIFSLRRRLRVQPGAAGVVAFATAFAATREEALALADEFHSTHAVTRAFELAWAHSRVELRHLNLSAEDVHLFQRLAGHVLFAGPTLRAAPAVLAANTQGQPGLWRHGISGDRPIVVVRVGEPPNLALVRTLLQAHTYWRAKGLAVDLVLLNENPASYFEDVHQQVQGLVRASDAHALIDRPGGVFIRKASHMTEADRTLLLAAARVVLAGDHGPLRTQIDVVERRESQPAALKAKRRPTPYSERVPPPPADLTFGNGLGGFTADGREYVVAAGAVPPAPWINVIANPDFGFLVSDSGAGYTWAGNSQLNRLTPWSNDPVADPPGEVLYVRDEETGEVWAPTPLPLPGAAPTVVRHGAGYTVFEQTRGGLEQRLRLFVAPDEPVKFVCLKVANRGNETRRLSATFYAEWVLGTTRGEMAPYVVTEADADGALLARNAFNTDFGSTIAFLDVGRPHTMTGDRTEFLGRNGSADNPAALKRADLSGRVGPGLDPCAAVQTKFSLAPGEETEVVFVFGQAADRNAAGDLARRSRDPQAAEAAFRAASARWDEVLSAVQVRTPDPAFDLLLNRWLLTQVLACRLWGRSAFYQSGGAYGFRDQLQDVCALVYAAPAEARAHILRAAARQFEEGDVQHWWHPPSGRGVRTRFSDDYLWLPFVVHHYVVTTGDAAVLDERAPFLKAPLLAPEEHEVYGLPSFGAESGTLYEHCTRALENGWKLGVHGLPLMGIGDWNDGMNRVGAGGKGESVWVGWFLLTCLNRFADLSVRRGDDKFAAHCRDRAEQLRKAVEAEAWDGDWYRRAYFDDGTPLGSSVNDECKIDSLTQTWAVISGAADPDRARRGMDAVEEHLVRRDAKLILLFTPPFDAGPLQPGYIKGYVPGIRENGGQYTHAATWVVQATALLGQGGKAMELFNLLSPITHTSAPDKVERYRVEPYVAVADAYGQPPHVGRGGWTWYTGTASWLYRVGLETILGFHKRGDRLAFDPRIPAEWKQFEIDYRHGSTRYHITVENPDGVEQGVNAVWLDDQEQPGADIALADDGGTHEVRVRMGAKVGG